MSNETTPEGAAYERYGDDTITESEHPIPDVREAHDADDHVVLEADPAHENAKADIALNESFPTSDAPGHAAPGTSDPAPSSGYDEQAERALANRKEASKGPVSGQDATAPKADPRDGRAVSELMEGRQPRMGPKAE